MHENTYIMLFTFKYESIEEAGDLRKIVPRKDPARGFFAAIFG
jgi:hypothetical protein